ncbi:MAG: membrane protein insertase YidC, partial [Deltaproteobacteria bacterium]|nr:membrane protein insertase YidC [Deltaproteobacteria bacterium]
GTVAGQAVAAGGAASPSFPERQTVITTDTERFVFSNHGASLRHVQLRESKYLLKRGDPDSGVDLMRAADPAHAPFRITFPDSAFPTPADTAWKLVDDAPATLGTEQVVYRAESPSVIIEKRFVIDKTRFRLHLDVVVQNRTAAPQDHHLGILVFVKQDAEAQGGFFSGAAGNTASILCHTDDKLVREPVENLEKDPFQKVGAVNWVAADEKFFLLAAVPYPETPPRERKCAGTLPGPGTGSGSLSFADRRVAPGARTQYSFTLFVGPKVIADLDEVRPGGRDVKLNEAVDVSLAVISRPMLWLLKFFYGFVKNWGVAIILLTIFIRLLTFYPTQKSLMSAKKMQKLGPKMAAIRKKYEGDKQRQSTETMSMYKAHGVSPFGGCLPSLIQMPIWIALYSTLNYAVELYRSPFIFHITDLTAKDQYYITPLLMGGVMFVQMKMSPTSPDNQQQAMMAIMMPVMFTAFSLVLPSGLAVYMLTSYLIGILQQLWVNHLDRKAHEPAPAPGRA